MSFAGQAQVAPPDRHPDSVNGRDPLGWGTNERAPEPLLQLLRLLQFPRGRDMCSKRSNCSKAHRARNGSLVLQALSSSNAGLIAT